MASEIAAAPVAALPKRKRIAGVIVTGHAFQHMYADGFLVLLPSIYDAFGLSGVSAGVLSAVRQGSAGLLTMGGGFVVDMFSGRRGLLLSGRLFLMGFVYLLVGAAPNYAFLLLALTPGSATGAFWPPVGPCLLAMPFPSTRAFVIALPRRSRVSAGPGPPEGGMVDRPFVGGHWLSRVGDLKTMSVAIAGRAERTGVYVRTGFHF